MEMIRVVKTGKVLLFIMLFRVLIACSTVEDNSSDTHSTLTFAKAMADAAANNGDAPRCEVFSKELLDPPTLSAKNFEINTQLRAEVQTKCVKGFEHPLQSYVDLNARPDSRPVGPAYIMEVDPDRDGPVLKINFKNALAPSDPRNDCHHHNRDYTKVCTNLHTHGFHVSPGTNENNTQSDNVFLKLAPQDSVQYEFHLPSSHAPGTHWLHAHVHGSTSPQVRNGMAGALILKGATDQWLADSYGIHGDKDKIMILQQLEDTNGHSLCGDSDAGVPITNSINGQCLPTITVTEKDVHHWRLIHAGVSAAINFNVEDSDGNKLGFMEYARDGINLGRAIQPDGNRITLYPGYRSDILFQVPAIEDVCADISPCHLYLVDGDSTASEGLLGTIESENVFAVIHVNPSTGTGMRMPPADDEHWAKPYPEITDEELERSAQPIEETRFGVLSGSRNTVNGKDYTVNGKVYPDGGTVQLQLNKAQTWKVWVDEEQVDTTNHPYHIHVNPFEVITRDSRGNIIDRYWKDTILISHADNLGKQNAVEIRARYENFTGKFVLHCHNLNHEDDGMMTDVRINP